MPKFMADECFSGPIIRAMRAFGFDVKRSAESLPAAGDEEVLAAAFAQQRVLLTEDFDFGELCVRFKLRACGVVIAAVKELPEATQCRRVVQALEQLGDQVDGSLVTIEPARVRLRPLEA